MNSLVYTLEAYYDNGDVDYFETISIRRTEQEAINDIFDHGSSWASDSGFIDFRVFEYSLDDPMHIPYDWRNFDHEGKEIFDEDEE